MKTIIAGIMMMFLVMMTGCTTPQSRKGGTLSQEKGFAIILPKNMSIHQGTTGILVVKLDRDPYFKRDVQMDITADGIDITPKSALLKASELPELELRIGVDSDAALGKYLVKITGTPSFGAPTEASFTVEVVKP